MAYHLLSTRIVNSCTFLRVQHLIPTRVFKSDFTSSQSVKDREQSKSFKWSPKQHDDWVNRMFGELRHLAKINKKSKLENQKQKSDQSQGSQVQKPSL